MDLTFSGAEPAPFLHLDSRTLVLSAGGRAVAFALSSAGRWLEETLMIILDEGRATRTQGDHVLGGFLGEDQQTVTLYGGGRENLIVVAVGAADFEALQRAVSTILHQRPEPPPSAPGKTVPRGRRRGGR